MTKREKIIVGLMVVSVLYGAYILFFDASGVPGKAKPSAKPTPVTLDKFVAEITQSLSGMDLTGPGAYVMKQAEALWENDPFVTSEVSAGSGGQTAAVGSVGTDTVFTYTGYLKMGNRDLAIINGIEYEPGEVLENAGYVVKKIMPAEVIIGISGQQTEFSVLLTETE